MTGDPSRWRLPGKVAVSSAGPGKRMSPEEKFEKAWEEFGEEHGYPDRRKTKQVALQFYIEGRVDQVHLHISLNNEGHSDDH